MAIHIVEENMKMHISNGWSEVSPPSPLPLLIKIILKNFHDKTHHSNSNERKLFSFWSGTQGFRIQLNATDLRLIWLIPRPCIRVSLTLKTRGNIDDNSIYMQNNATILGLFYICEKRKNLTAWQRPEYLLYYKPSGTKVPSPIAWRITSRYIYMWLAGVGWNCRQWYYERNEMQKWAVRIWLGVCEVCIFCSPNPFDNEETQTAIFKLKWR